MSSLHQFSPDFPETCPYETPFFLFRRDRILSNLGRFREAFPSASIHYAMKANSDPTVLRTLAAAGCGFEVASVYELEMLREISVPLDTVIYGSAVKPARFIEQAFKVGVDRFAFDSLPELEKIAEFAPGSRVYVRIMVNDSGSVFRFSEKFGAEPASAVGLLCRARDLGLQPYGLSFHVGSQASDPTAWANAVVSLAPALQALAEHGITASVINLGGGFPCYYASSEHAPSVETIAANFILAYEKLPYQPQVLLEPGRGIIADTAVLVTTVIARIKRGPVTWLFLDAGCYNGLFEAMAYQGSTRYPVTRIRSARDDSECLFALAGPTGDGPDVITREARLPGDTDVGDKLVFHNVGAYSLPFTSAFNGFPKPDVHFL